MRFSNLITNSAAVLTALLLGLTGCGGDVASTDGCDAFVGDIVISEIMANPEGTDTKSEWFEIYNASSRPQVLDRLVIRRLYFSSEGAVAVKIPKLGHDLRFDIPCLGARTLKTCASANIRALAFEAGRTLLLDESEVDALAQRHGITLTAV